MTKKIILGIAAAAVLVASLMAFIPEAISDPKVSKERDNTTVTGLTTSTSTASLVGAIVLLDNAGIGGTSDVEVTWTAPFSDPDCKLVTVEGSPSASPGDDPAGNAILGNDMVFMTVLGYMVAHNDVAGTEAILLVDIDDDSDPCALGTDFITISTVGSQKVNDDDDDGDDDD